MDVYQNSRLEFKVQEADKGGRASGALALTLKEVGYSVLEARNGREGLEMLRNEPADLVLLDVYILRKTGWRRSRDSSTSTEDTHHRDVGGGSNRSLDILQVASLLGARCTLINRLNCRTS